MKTTEQLQADRSAADITSKGDSTSPSAAAPSPDLASAPSPGLAARVVGCVLGAAIGDALGHPTEFINSFDALFELFGPQGVTGYELYWEHGGKRFAPYTDDTQMAELVLRNLIWARETGADLERAMTDLGARFARWATHPQGGHRAPGNACLSGSHRLAEGVPWDEAGGAQAGGCGSVMRVYPMGLLFSHESDELERWAVAQSKLTHRAPIALAACASMARATSLALRGESVPRILEEMVAAAARHDPGTAEMTVRAIEEARSGIEPRVTLERLQGWAAHECIAAAAYVLARHPDSFRDGVLEAANTPGDSDSIATLVGALLGARHGSATIPEAWKDELERSAELKLLARRCAAFVV